jgi:hypothetical protein
MNVANLNLSNRLLRAVRTQALAARPAPAAAPGAATALASTTATAATVPLNLPPDVTDWLANLSLLYGVPFEYLVPDVRLLPIESIRFFYIDPNWIRRAIDGALSIGTTSTRDNVFNEVFYEQVYDAVQAAIPLVRQTLRNAEQPAQITVGATTSGFLFRSAVVAGYPGLEVVPTLGGNPVPILRLDRVSNDIMLALFNGVPDHVKIRQPPEGLHFGIDRAKGASVFNIHLRWLGHSSPLQSADVAGNQIDLNVPPQKPPKPPIKPWVVNNAPMRSGTGQPPGVIDVTKTANLITTTLSSAYLGPNSVFTSAEFAIEMVLSAGVQPYDVKAGGNS